MQNNALLLVAVATLCWAADVQDRVTSVPGLTEPFAELSYAGYLQANDVSKGALYYWYFECSNPVLSPDAPVLFWYAKYILFDG